MTKNQNLFTETTDVPAQRSIAAITQLLIEAGAVSINTNFESGKVASLSFVLPYGAGRIPYLLPVRTGAVAEKFAERRKKTQGYYAYKWKAQDLEQAERVAWRQLYWWLKSQLALIASAAMGGINLLFAVRD